MLIMMERPFTAAQLVQNQAHGRLFHILENLKEYQSKWVFWKHARRLNKWEQAVGSHPKPTALKINEWKQLHFINADWNSQNDVPIYYTNLAIL